MLKNRNLNNFTPVNVTARHWEIFIYLRINGTTCGSNIQLGKTNKLFNNIIVRDRDIKVCKILIM